MDLHCASFFGIAEVVAALIEMGCYDINERDFLGCTVHYLHGLLIMGMRGRCGFCSEGKRSIPAS